MDEIVLEYAYTVGGYITFSVRVIAGEFSGASGFCIAERWLKDAISNLSEMISNLRGEYQMDDYDSDDFMCFKMKKSGHMTVTGQIGGSYNATFMKYEYCADQTVLAEIIASFTRMISLQVSPEEYFARKQSTEC